MKVSKAESKFKVIARKKAKTEKFLSHKDNGSTL